MKYSPRLGWAVRHWCSNYGKSPKSQRRLSKQFSAIFICHTQQARLSTTSLEGNGQCNLNYRLLRETPTPPLTRYSLLRTESVSFCRTGPREEPEHIPELAKIKILNQQNPTLSSHPTRNSKWSPTKFAATDSQCMHHGAPDTIQQSLHPRARRKPWIETLAGAIPHRLQTRALNSTKD